MEALRAFRSRNFRLFFSGQSISLLGTWVQKTAVVWLVYRLTGSPFLLGVTGFVGLFPTLVLSPFVGSYIDRHNKFKVMVQTQVWAAVQALLLALLIFFSIYNIPAIILLSLLQGIINAVDVTCRQSLMVELVDNPGDVSNAIALNSTITNLTRVLGPALGGLLLGVWGEDVCFISNFLSFIPVLYCLYLMSITPTVHAAEQRSFWAELKEGFVYIRTEREITGQLLLLTITSFCLIPFTTILPILAKDIFKGNATVFSWFESAIGLGSLLSAVYMARLKQLDRLVRVIMVASCLFSGGLILLSQANNMVFALVSLTLGGAGMMAQSSSINTYIQTHSAPQMRARAISYFIMAYMGVTPIGTILLGWVAEHYSVKTVFFIEGLCGVFAVGFYLWYRARYILTPMAPNRKNDSGNQPALPYIR